jgi:ankyrin repeat protein
MNTIDRELLKSAEDNILPEVRRLLSVGADVNAKCNGDWTPLHRVSYRGHVQIVKELVEHGADIEATTIIGWTPLHFACSQDHLAVVNELLGHGVITDANNDSSDGTTTILGKRKSRGANIEAKDRDGETPLHIASAKGHLAVVKALLSSGANILAAKNDGHLPIHRAVRQGKSAVSKYLFQQLYATVRHLPLHELLKDLTWIGDPYISIGVIVPPLCSALCYNLLGMDDVVEILEYLVGQNPALLSAHDQDGALPIHVACRRGASFAIVQSLTNHYKASVKSLTPQGDLPLFLACEKPGTSLDTIFLLIKLYPDLVYR